MKLPTIVIGSGIGGLSGAVRLAMLGEKVILIEKEPRPGGYAIHYTRGGYTFDLALHVVPSAGPGQEFNRLLQLLDINKEIDFIKLREGFRVVLGDFTLQMPNSFAHLFELLDQEFPAEREGLKRFAAHLQKYVPAYIRILDQTTPKFQSLPGFLPKLPAFLHQSYLPTRKYFQTFFTDHHLMAILFQPALFMGIPMDEFPTVNFMMMFYLLMQDGMYYIKGGGQALTDSLQKKLQTLGGEIITGRKVEKLHLQANRVVEVELSSGKPYRVEGVLAGNNLIDVVNRQIGRDHLPNSYLKAVDSLTNSISVLALQLGITGSPAAFGITNHITMVFPDEHIDYWIKKQRQSGTVYGFSVTCPAITDDTFAADSHFTLSIVAGTDPQFWMQLSEQDYKEQKQQTIRNIIEQLAGLYPGIEDHIAVSDLATPRTMQRYTANPGGAIMGFGCTCGSHRQLMKAADLPIRNLIMASAWTDKLGGFMQSMNSGITAAEKLARRAAR